MVFSSERAGFIPKIALIEVATFYLLLQSLMWWGKEIKPALPFIAVLIIGICVASNIYHNDSLERIGLSKKNFWPTFKAVVPIAAPLLVILISLILFREKKGGQSWDLLFSVLGYPIWGFVQEYALLGFVANRLEDGLERWKGIVPWVNGFLFAMAHCPNPMLMVVTFFSGTLFTNIFFKSRHLIPLSLMHAAFGIAINLAFSDVPGIMSVGPSYLARIGKGF